jgi:hypothetical protein
VGHGEQQHVGAGLAVELAAPQGVVHGPLMYLSGRGGLAGLGMTLADLGGLGHKIVADPVTPLLAAYEAWKRTYTDLVDGFGAGKPTRDRGPLEKDMLGVIELERLLAIERATVEK